MMMEPEISQSSDPGIHEQFCQYVMPTQTKEAIRATIQDTIRDSPLILINTTSGRLCSRSEQATAFESMPAFKQLVSSMTTHIDHARIEQEVRGYYRYAMFSHRWEETEPLFEKVVDVVVYDLGETPAHEKLKMFCEVVREAGLHWAWSDTCCINKSDHFILQEALVSMFKWYHGSAMTIILLSDVPHLSSRGALARSIWNTRGWTLQEYHASKVARFYTQDWTPYLNLDIRNHKESPEIISEMEEATGVSAQALTALQPGLDDIRDKLCLASSRRTTRVEDAAYSLLGIFSVSLPIIYGEGDKALGRLLAHLLTNSGEASILAWIGTSGNFNSCLPANITVFGQSPTSHIPVATVTGVEMETIIAPSLDITLGTKLYDQVKDLPTPSFSVQRMRLPCLTFKLGRVSASLDGSKRIFRAQATALGVVAIRTEEDLSQLGALYLVHPWIDFLLDRHPIRSATGTIAESMDDQPSVLGELPSFTTPSETTSTALRSRGSVLGRPFSGRPNTFDEDAASLLPPSTVSPIEKQQQVLQFISRLRQPFGALLLTPTRRNVEEYRRVAADSLIAVRVEEITPTILNKLTRSARMLDVL